MAKEGEFDRVKIPFLYGSLLKFDSKQSKSPSFSYLLYVKSPRNTDLSAVIEKVSFHITQAKGEPLLSEKFLGTTVSCPYFFLDNSNESFRVKCVIELRKPFSHCPIELEIDVSAEPKNALNKRACMCVNSDEIILQNCPEELKQLIKTGAERIVEPAYKSDLVEAVLALDGPTSDSYQTRLELAREFLQEEIELAVTKLKEIEDEIESALRSEEAVLHKRESIKSNT